MKNLAILIDRLGYSQKLKRIIEECNKLPSDINIVLFSAEYGPLPAKTNFPIMEMIKCFDFDGTFISTDIYTTQIMQNVLLCKKKIFYVYDLEYLYQPYTFSILNSIFNSDIDLVARNQYRYDILKNTWKEPIDIMEEFNHKTLMKLT
jgi:hypothetical protein